MTINQGSSQPSIPAIGFVRKSAFLPMLGFSSTTLWRRVNDGSFPQPVKLSARVTAWRAEDIHAWMASKGNGQQAA